MKKRFKEIFAVILTLALLGTSVAAYTYTSVNINSTMTYAESNQIGTAVEATYTGSNYSSSVNSLVVKCYARWAGWPFTKEKEQLLYVGDNWTWDETQAYMSYYKVVLDPSGTNGTGCNGYGQVEID